MTDSTTPTRHVLLNETLRTAFVNDLSELLAFLEGRIAESARSEDPVAPDEYEKRSPGLAPRLFSSTLSTAASAVREALNAACAPDLERSLRAASEPRFRARAAMAMEAHPAKHLTRPNGRRRKSPPLFRTLRRRSGLVARPSGSKVRHIG